MKRVIALFFAFLAVVAIAAAQDMTIKVGDGGLVFNPATGTTSPGSTLTFEWVSTTVKHSVFQADDGSCNPSASATAFKAAANVAPFNATFKVPANMPKLWFICNVPTHCAQGMKMVLTVTGATGGSSTNSSSSGSGTTGSSPSSSSSPSSGSGYGSSSAATLGATFGTIFTALVASVLL